MSERLAADGNAALPPLGTPQTQSDLVASSLREAILTGRLEQDEMLVERRIAAQLGVSKTPVREALIQLTNSGLVTTTRNRGVRVRRLTSDDARQVYEQRLLLEPWAVAEAVRSKRSDFSAARTACARSDALLEAEDWPRLALANRAFHRTMYGECPNRMIIATLDAMQDLTAMATMKHWAANATAGPEHEQHRETLRLGLAGEAEAAAEVMRRHIEETLQRVVAAFGATTG